MTKFLYHIQLLKLGVNNVISTGFQTVLMYLAILLFALFFNSKLFVVLWLSAPLFVVIFLVTDYIGRHYITREQTFNSRIVSHLADSMFNFDLIKSQGREKDKLKEFENIIDIDTFFRIRRYLWIQYSNRILYGIILLVGISFYFVQIYWPFIEFDSLTNLAATGIILGYFIRLLYSTARVGIFYEAFRLGLRLVLPKFPYSIDTSLRNPPKWNNLRFQSKKTKLSKYGGYINNFRLELSRGSKYLIYSEDAYGKSSLAKIIVGKKVNPSIIINDGKRRINTIKWSSYKSNNFYIADSVRFDISLAEYIFGKGVDDISRKDIDKIINELKPLGIFDFMFDHREFIGRNVQTDTLSKTENILLQIAHCIIKPKSIIAVDHTCLDGGNEKIIKALKILLDKCPKTTFVFFSNKPNTYFEYEKTFELNKAEFKEV
jgi:ABC-type transport system involved in cytochrome bd biosynthesis fused ATPase/permease subunit